MILSFKIFNKQHSHKILLLIIDMIGRINQFKFNQIFLLNKVIYI